MKKNQSGRTESSPSASLRSQNEEVNAYGIDGKIYPKESLSPKQIKEVEKSCAKMRKKHERALKSANEVLNPPTKTRVWFKRILIGALLCPGSALVPAAIGIEGCAGIPADPKPAPKIEACEPISREWIDKDTIFGYFNDHIEDIVPTNIIPLEMGGEVYEAQFEMNGTLFHVRFFVRLNDNDGRFSGSGMYVMIREDGFLDEHHYFIRDKGIQL